jgi:hypothetical protein
MQVSTKKPPFQTTPSTESSSEKKFTDIWRRVVSQQKKNDSLRTEAQAFAQSILSRIEDEEKASMDVMYVVCLRLLSFCGRKSLAQWHREVLIDWAGEYMLTMTDHPFAEHLDMAALRQRMADAFAFAYPERSPVHDASADGFPFDEDELHMTEDEEPASTTGNSSGRDDDVTAEQAFFDQYSQQRQAEEQQRQDESQALKQLIRSSSVNKLFRKLAGILHPDRAGDETARLERNRLMSELIQARDSNDVPKLFAFYAAYVGNSPLLELGGDLESATQLLERHLLSLREQEDSILDADPLTGALYRRFHRSTPAARKRAVNKHLKELQAHANALTNLSHDITSVNRLKPYLEYRRDMMFQEDVFGFL